jgi:hypothetical protein
LSEGFLAYDDLLPFLDPARAAYYLPGLMVLSLDNPSSPFACSVLLTIGPEAGPESDLSADAASHGSEEPPKLVTYLLSVLTREQKQLVAGFLHIMVEYERAGSSPVQGVQMPAEYRHAERALSSLWLDYLPGG